MRNETVAILEGERISDNSPAIKVLGDMGFHLLKLGGLYRAPHKLQRLPEIDPEYIYIRTTGTVIGWRSDSRERLKQEFLEIEWIPDNVIFFNDTSAETYADIARTLKQAGTNFYFLPFEFGNEYEFREIEWL